MDEIEIDPYDYVNGMPRIVTEYTFNLLEGVPPVTGIWKSRPTAILPQTLKITLNTGGFVKWVSVTGPAQRRDGSIGTHRHTDGWSWYVHDTMPAWISALLEAERLEWSPNSDV